MTVLSLYTHLKLSVAVISEFEDKCIYYFELT